MSLENAKNWALIYLGIIGNTKIIYNIGIINDIEF